MHKCSIYANNQTWILVVFFSANFFRTALSFLDMVFFMVNLSNAAEVKNNIYFRNPGIDDFIKTPTTCASWIRFHFRLLRRYFVVMFYSFGLEAYPAEKYSEAWRVYEFCFRGFNPFLLFKKYQTIYLKSFTLLCFLHDI